MSAQLLPCDFCAGEDAFVERRDYSSCYVVCNDCGARGPSSCDENEADAIASEAGECEPGERAAVRLWNTRAPNAAAEGLAKALEEAAAWFDDYATEHYRKAKNAPSAGEQHGSEVKGKTNADRAAELRTALAAYRAGQPS